MSDLTRQNQALKALTRQLRQKVCFPLDTKGLMTKDNTEDDESVETSLDKYITEGGCLFGNIYHHIETNLFYL